jgi:hypothetical protein
MKKLLLFVVLATLLNTSVYAYIDPGTGSFLLQGILAAFFGGFFALKLYFQRFKAYLFGNKTIDQTVENQDDKHNSGSK